jgi:hypothetical protein
MVKFMPDPLSSEEFDTLKQIGLLPVKMQAANQSEKQLVLTDDGMMRIAMGK